MARSAVSSDYYSILGVSPTAEDVVIRAAYRALMRHYHPDTNPNPEAQRRAQEIASAFAVLRDPAQRAEYDAGRRGPVLWAEEELPMPPARPPAMRSIGIASTALALALVLAVWARPQPDAPKARVAQTTRQPPPPKPQPVVELEPESARLALLRCESSQRPQLPPEGVPPIAESLPLAPIAAPLPHSAPVRIAASAPRLPPARTAHPPASSVPSPLKASSVASEASAGCSPSNSVVVSSGCKNERVATLDRMAAGFFSQSMAHADAAKKELLLTSHSRSAATRGACHSDSCLSNAYLRQMREISAIMEGRPLPAQ